MPNASVSWGDPNHLVAVAREHRLELDRDASAESHGLSAGELLLMSLGACIAGTLRSHSSVAQMPIRELEVRLHGERLERPGRYDDFTIEVVVGGELTEKQLATLQRVAGACRVHTTLHNGVKTTLDVIPTGLSSSDAAGG